MGYGHQRCELVDRIDVSRAEHLLGVAGLEERHADHPANRLGRLRHREADHPGHLFQLVRRQPGIEHLPSDSRELDVLVGVGTLAVRGVGSSERLHQLSDVGGSQVRRPGDVGQRVFVDVAERYLDRARGKLAVAACAIDLVIADIGFAQVSEQAFFGIHGYTARRITLPSGTGCPSGRAEKPFRVLDHHLVDLLLGEAVLEQRGDDAV